MSTLTGFKRLFKANQNELIIKFLGKSSIASNITYLTPRHLFLGSQIDDSYLIKIHDQFTKDGDKPFLEHVLVFKNLGFVSDLRIIKKPGGSKSILTASDMKNHDQINIINNGVDMKVELDLSKLDSQLFKNISNIYTLNFSISNSSYFIISKTDYSCIYRINNGVISPILAKGFDYQTNTFKVCLVDDENFIQITSNHINLFSINDNMMDDNEFILKDNFALNGDEKVISCDTYDDQIVFITQKNKIYSAIIKDSKIIIINSIDAKDQILSVGISKNHVAIALWKCKTINIYDFTSLNLVYQRELSKSGIKSIKFLSFNGENQYIFCGNFDGSFVALRYSFMIDIIDHNFNILEESSYTFGSTPLNLQGLIYGGKRYLFVGCDTPMLVYLSNYNNKLANIHILKENVFELHKIQIQEKEYVLTLIDNTVNLGFLEDDDKVLVKSLPIHIKDSVNFVVHISDINSFIAGINYLNSDFTEGIGHINIYDGNSFMLMNSIRLDDSEICCMKDIVVYETKFLIVGGGNVSNRKGFLILFKILPEGLVKIQEKFYEKYVIDVDMLMDEFIIIGQNSTLRILKIKEEIRGDNKYHIQGNVILEEILVKNIDTARMRMTCEKNMILSVDAIKGISLFIYNKNDNKLVKFGTSMRSTIDNEIGCIIDENVIFMSCQGKFKVLHRNKDGDHESERLSFIVILFF